MRPDMIPGAVFPDYELADHTAKHRKLSELQGQHPMVVVLGRGGYCPKDRRQAEGLVQLHREMEVGYCRLVTISTDNITQTNEYRSGVGAHWPFLSDSRRIVLKDLDIAEYTDPANNPMIPHVKGSRHIIGKAKAIWPDTGCAGSGYLSTDPGVLAEMPYPFRT
jgi:peroxiredoxin